MNALMALLVRASCRAAVLFVLHLPSAASACANVSMNASSSSGHVCGEASAGRSLVFSLRVLQLLQSSTSGQCARCPPPARSHPPRPTKATRLRLARVTPRRRAAHPNLITTTHCPVPSTYPIHAEPSFAVADRSCTGTPDLQPRPCTVEGHSAERE